MFYYLYKKQCTVLGMILKILSRQITRLPPDFQTFLRPCNATPGFPRPVYWLQALIGSTSTKIVLITMMWESIKVNFKNSLVVINISCLHDDILREYFYKEYLLLINHLIKTNLKTISHIHDFNFQKRQEAT